MSGHKEPSSGGHGHEKSSGEFLDFITGRAIEMFKNILSPMKLSDAVSTTIGALFSGFASAPFRRGGGGSKSGGQVAHAH